MTALSMHSSDGGEDSGGGPSVTHGGWMGWEGGRGGLALAACRAHGCLRCHAVPCRRVHLDETQEEFWLRLNEEAARRQTALQAIENVQAAQYTFQPAINPKSRQVRGCLFLRCCSA